MMQNGLNESFWDGLGVEFGPCADFIKKKIIVNQSFFDNSFDRYPIGEKTEVADSEKRTPEAKFRPFFSNILVVPEFQNGHP